jgi:hypothetical protein
MPEKPPTEEREGEREGKKKEKKNSHACQIC